MSSFVLHVHDSLKYITALICCSCWWNVTYSDIPLLINVLELTLQKAHVLYVFPQANIALFEARCKEKIQQFEDAGSDEEDIWDEKDVTFAPEAQRRPR